MEYNIAYKASVKRDLKKIDKREIKKILDLIEASLINDPFNGKQLKGEYKGLYSYRIADYRVIYSTLGSTILILRIRHRKDTYKC